MGILASDLLFNHVTMKQNNTKTMKKQLFLISAVSILIIILFSCEKDKAPKPPDYSNKLSLPVVTTIATTNITTNSAISGGIVTSDGNGTVSARGVCWNTSGNPTLENCVGFTENGSGTGVFTSNITDLNSLQQYYTVAYATNEEGNAYGLVIIFETTLEIGDIYAGGIVFYLDGNDGGLVCAESNQSTGAEWGCYGTTIGVTSTAIGTGASNTAAIIAGCSESGIAARICNDLVLNGYNDWFLPSKGELYLMYENLQLAGVGGFGYNFFWSSSEFNSCEAWNQYFYNGNPSNYNKYFNIRVRAVRAF
jgi:hypothetical protein